MKPTKQTHEQQPLVPSSEDSVFPGSIDEASERGKSPEIIAAERLCYITTGFLEVADRISLREPITERVTEVRIPEIHLGDTFGSQLSSFPAFTNYPLEATVVYRRPIGDRPDLTLSIQAVNDEGVVVGNMEVSRPGISAPDAPFSTLLSAPTATGEVAEALTGEANAEETNTILANGLYQRRVFLRNDGTNQAESNENLPDFQDSGIAEAVQDALLMRWPDFSRTATTHMIELGDETYRVRICADDGRNSAVRLEKLGDLHINENTLGYAIHWAVEISASNLMTCLTFPHESSSDHGEQEYNVLKTLELLARLQSRYDINPE